jgi:hypothetical protein
MKRVLKEMLAAAHVEADDGRLVSLRESLRRAASEMERKGAISST